MTSSLPLHSPMGCPRQYWQIRQAMTLGPNHNPRLGFQASIHRSFSSKPSRLGTPETHPRSLFATQEETMSFLAAQNPQNRRDLHAFLRPPPLSAAPWPQSQSMMCHPTPTHNSTPQGSRINAGRSGCLTPALNLAPRGAHLSTRRLGLSCPSP